MRGVPQGMNFVCRCLLQVFDEEEAFWVFAGMLQRFGLRRLYCPGMPLLRLRCVGALRGEVVRRGSWYSCVHVWDVQRVVG